MESDPIAIVRRCFEAYADSDRDALEALIAPDFQFTSPLDNRLSRQTYFDRCWPNHEWIERFEFIRLVRHGDEVVATYEGHSSEGKVFRNTEVLTVADGQIAEVEVYFGWTVPHEAEPGGFIPPK